VVRDMNFWHGHEFDRSGFEVGDGDDRKTQQLV
jgi:hypothetical protein